jgi:hypothetical protein
VTETLTITRHSVQLTKEAEDRVVEVVAEMVADYLVGRLKTPPVGDTKKQEKADGNTDEQHA